MPRDGRRKLIEFGWDVPSPSDVRDHVRAMERRPFDGVVVRLPEDAGAGNIFDVACWRRTIPARRDEEVAILRQVRWQRFTDNFVALYGASTMDWFDDGDWADVLANVRYCARAAKAGGCVGVMWDPEPYGGNPWVYATQPRRAERSFADYRAVVRRRGAEVMTALQDEFPGLTILTLRLLSDYADQSHFAGGILNEKDPAAREAMLQRFFFGMHADFLDGLLDAAGPGVRIVDGNEDAYYFASRDEFVRTRRLIGHDLLEFVAPENRDAYQARVEVGQALYLDYLYGRWDALASFPLHLVRQARELTEEQRDRWLEHNAYYALATADEYAWVYSESMSWWTGEGVPPGAEAALISAKRKHDAGEPLGFAVEEVLRDAQARARARLDRERLARRADVPSVAPAVAGAIRDGGPATDGLLALEPFVPKQNSEAEPENVMPTQAWIGYDDDAFYAVVRCDEPRPDLLSASGEEGLAEDDAVRLLIARGESNGGGDTDGGAALFEFGLNPRGDRLAVVRANEGTDEVAGEWQGAARVGADRWEAVFALPWATVGLVPRPGARLRGNFARQRVGGIAEKRHRPETSWSQVEMRVDEADHLGEWTLG